MSTSKSLSILSASTSARAPVDYLDRYLVIESVYAMNFLSTPSAMPYLVWMFKEHLVCDVIVNRLIICLPIRNCFKLSIIVQKPSSKRSVKLSIIVKKPSPKRISILSRIAVINTNLLRTSSVTQVATNVVSTVTLIQYLVDIGWN